MDISLVREAKEESDVIDGKKIRYPGISSISDITKATLRILYECGERPLYAFNGSEEFLSVSTSPQQKPTCIIMLGSKEKTYLSAIILKEQMEDVGINLDILKLDQLSNHFFGENVNSIYSKSLQYKLEKLKENGHQHVIFVGDSKMLNIVNRLITNENLPEQEDQSTCLWGIKDGKLGYVYNSQKVDYVTEGFLDTKLVAMVNSGNCPESLIKYHGKIKKPIDGFRFYYEFRNKSLNR